ncbi:MAG: MOSC N-terminal beta barrel domain-containing protein [Bacillus sp. (in: firmicutes)]
MPKTAKQIIEVNKLKIGEIKKLVRHPVKSFTGESVSSAQIMRYGLYGDRSHGFKDKSNKNKYLTITQYPKMVTYSAKFLGEDNLQKYPPMKLRMQKGRNFNGEMQGCWKNWNFIQKGN